MGRLLTFLKRRGKTKPARNEFDDAASDLEVRAQNLRTGNGLGFVTQASAPTAELIDALAKFVKTLGAASASADRVTRVIVWLTVIGVVVALTNVALVVVQILESDRAIHMQNVISLNGQFFHDPVNLQIIDAIESNKPILTQHQGRIASYQLDNYLGDLETIGDAYSDGQISEKEMCSSFSTVVTETLNYPEIKQYLAADKSDLYGGAIQLGDAITKSKLEDCH